MNIRGKEVGRGVGGAIIQIVLSFIDKINLTR